MFDDYAKDLKKFGANVPVIFENVAKDGADKFVNTAQDLTDNEGLVDTGYYKQNWHAEATKLLDGTQAIYCENSAEYSMALEEGHKTINGGRVKGYFVGRRAVDETSFFCIEQLQDELDKAHEKSLRGD